MVLSRPCILSNAIVNASDKYNELWKNLGSDNDRISFDDIHYDDTSLYLQSQYINDYFKMQNVTRLI